MINLNNLSVPTSLQTKLPNEDSYPLVFNPQAFKFWLEALSVITSTNVEREWDRVIKKFTSICERNNVFPFTEHQTSNDQILYAFITNRRAVVKTMDKYKVLSLFKVYKTKRKVTMNAKGFLLEVDADCSVQGDIGPLIDKMGLRKTNQAFATIYSRDLGNNVTFYVANEGARMSQRWHFGYTMDIKINPYVPGNPTPTSQQLEDFILKVLYLPILRSYRPVSSKQLRLV